eukprot:1145686-Prymnesium_polylepis.1
MMRPIAYGRFGGQTLYLFVRGYRLYSTHASIGRRRGNCAGRVVPLPPLAWGGVRLIAICRCGCGCLNAEAKRRGDSALAKIKPYGIGTRRRTA